MVTLPSWQPFQVGEMLILLCVKPENDKEKKNIPYSRGVALV